MPGVNIRTTPGTSVVTADNQGKYELLYIDPGDYTLTAEKPGYQTVIRNLAIIAGQTTVADLVMSPDI